MNTQIHKKQYYPAFLKDFRGEPFDAGKLGAAFILWRSKDVAATPESTQALFSEFRIDEAHWHFHQRILNDEVLFRLIAEGFIHPKVHPVAEVYADPEFYAFVFPFIHTAVLKRMATSIGNGNLEAVKLIEQWIEPFGTLFRDDLYQLIEYFTLQLSKQLAELQLQNKPLTQDTYNKISPALMHLLNRLPGRAQQLRDQFGMQLIEVATWLKDVMRVYTQPSGLMTRLKLLNVSPDIHAQRSILISKWDKEAEEAGKSKFSVNHLIWIIPLVLLAGFFIWRQTDMGKSMEDRMEDRAEDLAAEQAVLDSIQNVINTDMNSIDLNELVVKELVGASANGFVVNAPDAYSGTAHLDNGEMVYQDWLKTGRTVYFADQNTLSIVNSSKCDVIVFVRQIKEPFLERAYYVRAGRSVAVLDDAQKNYQLRMYGGTEWRDSLVTSGFDKVLSAAGVPSEAMDAVPDPPDLRGRFLYPVQNTKDIAKYFSSAGVTAYIDVDGVRTVVIIGDNNGLTTQ